MSTSVRLNREEWEKIVQEGNKFFSEREVGYVNVVPSKISFEIYSPYFKDLKDLDDEDKERSDEDQAKRDKVMDEIKNKGSQR